MKHSPDRAKPKAVHTLKTCDDLRVEIIIWIERTYNRQRRQRRLGKPTPTEYELVHHNPQTQAA
jgi:transposase InsO family protein